MSTSPTTDGTTYDDKAPGDIFGDPVAYLAGLGIDAELVSETTLAVAA